MVNKIDLLFKCVFHIAYLKRAFLEKNKTLLVSKP